MGKRREASILNILGWIVVGLIGGLIARAIVPGRDPGGIILTILLGIAGAILGGFLSVALGVGNGIDNFDLGSILLAIVGAVILLIGYHLVAGPSRDSI
jgi:uncharacterized membrane protein YeaQ/YmgE (transglycosylase-associated protein family)